MQSKSNTSCQCCTVPSQQPRMPSHWYKLLDIHAEPDSCVELHRIRKRRSFGASILNSTLSADINIADESYRSKSEYFSKYSNVIHALPSLYKDNLVCYPYVTLTAVTQECITQRITQQLFVDGQISTIVRLHYFRVLRWTSILFLFCTDVTDSSICKYK